MWKGENNLDVNSSGTYSWAKSCRRWKIFKMICYWAVLFWCRLGGTDNWIRDPEEDPSAGRGHWVIQGPTNQRMAARSQPHRIRISESKYRRVNLGLVFTKHVYWGLQFIMIWFRLMSMEIKIDFLYLLLIIYMW